MISWILFLVPLAFVIFCGVEIFVALKSGVTKGMGGIRVTRDKNPHGFKRNLIGLVIVALWFLFIWIWMLPGLIQELFQPTAHLPR